MSGLWILLQIARRNLFGSLINVVIGGIMLVGTLLFVVGGSLLNSIDSAMSKSITGSVAGHIQVYSDKSKDDLSLFDSWKAPDLAAIPDFSKIKPALLGVSNVKAVVPMGSNSATISYGNTLDVILERLRQAESQKLKGDGTPALGAKIESLKNHVRQTIRVIQNDYKKLAVMASSEAVDQEGAKALDRAASDDFWASFDRSPLDHLEFMENKIASLLPDADYIYLNYVGTDLEAFRASFDRMEVVDGQMVPAGQRGLMLSKYEYEEQFKLKTAHRLDRIREAVQDAGKKIARDPDLQLMIKQNRSQTREILLQLDPISAGQVLLETQTFLHSEEKDLGKLLNELFATDDQNFIERYKFFYAHIAPQLELYRLKPGDMLPIKSFTKGGYVQSANVKVYGTFQFKGLEKSGMAGGMSLMDLMTFRDLYGYVTPERLKESRQLETSAGVKMIDRGQAEAELFGGTSVVGAAQENKIDDQAEMGGVKYDANAEDMRGRTYTNEEIEQGVVLNAAIILKDPSLLKKTIQEIQTASEQQHLDLRVASWQKAAGSIGQFVFIAKAVLYFAVFIIFVVALVIINNAVMMATLQRVREIGTMRAIGAQRAFVLGMVLLETLLLGLTFGTVGTALGALISRGLGIHGIPAANEFLYFFFSGPRLYVTLDLPSLAAALFIICLVTCLSALYPALIATRITPLQAMQTED